MTLSAAKQMTFERSENKLRPGKASASYADRRKAKKKRPLSGRLHLTGVVKAGCRALFGQCLFQLGQYFLIDFPGVFLLVDGEVFQCFVAIFV